MQAVAGRRPWTLSGFADSTVSKAEGFLSGRWLPVMRALHEQKRLPQPTLHISAITSDRIPLFLSSDMNNKHDNG